MIDGLGARPNPLDVRAATDDPRLRPEAGDGTEAVAHVAAFSVVMRAVQVRPA